MIKSFLLALLFLVISAIALAEVRAEDFFPGAQIKNHSGYGRIVDSRNNEINRGEFGDVRYDGEIKCLVMDRGENVRVVAANPLNGVFGVSISDAFYRLLRGKDGQLIGEKQEEKYYKGNTPPRNITRRFILDPVTGFIKREIKR